MSTLIYLPTIHSLSLPFPS
ncbi:hypothetical protein E2C01_086065 [Portunus trituberculatus]|uniref:Uncharacterized protein n=1 Tax=Portunus trituberculatus TaxID=210409 RepID=A0A5B7J4G4_PORTR|nr:hypothetical protein [Portunus trituberculatus]